MKQNTVTLTIGLLLLVIFVLLLFTFQVRQTEVAVLTRFDKPVAFHDSPGLKWKLPRPIHRVYTFDKRIQNFEDAFETALTQDQFSLLISVYAGWTITNPTNFFARFPTGQIREAIPTLEQLIRAEKLAVVGSHPFAHFVSTQSDRLKIEQIEKEMLQRISGAAVANYGISIQFLGIKKLGLPESVTQKVFERMQAERQREIDRLRAEGESQAAQIKSQADRERAEIIAAATARATTIRGEADAEAARSFSVFEKNPELAIYLRKLAAMEEVLKERSTLILDDRTPPFDLLTKPLGGSHAGRHE